jgi:hypothetical protein
VIETFDTGGNTNIFIGEVVTIRAGVINLPSSLECDLAVVSNATTNLFRVAFDGDGGGNFVTVFDSVHTQHELASGGQFNWNLQAQFNQPGTYILGYTTDYGAQVDERNEDNNSNFNFAGRPMADQTAEDGWSEHVKTTNNYRFVRITVMLDKDKEKELAGRPAFEVVSLPWNTRVFEMNGK